MREAVISVLCLFAGVTCWAEELPDAEIEVLFKDLLDSKGLPYVEKRDRLLASQKNALSFLNRKAATLPAYGKERVQVDILLDRLAWMEKRKAPVPGPMTGEACSREEEVSRAKYRLYERFRGYEFLLVEAMLKGKDVDVTGQDPPTSVVLTQEPFRTEVLSKALVALENRRVAGAFIEMIGGGTAGIFADQMAAALGKMSFPALLEPALEITEKASPHVMEVLFDVLPGFVDEHSWRALRRAMVRTDNKEFWAGCRNLLRLCDVKTLQRLQCTSSASVVTEIPEGIAADSPLRDDYVVLLCQKLLDAGKAKEANDLLLREAKTLAADATLDVEFFLPQPDFARTMRPELSEIRGHTPRDADDTRWPWVVFDSFNPYYRAHPVRSLDWSMVLAVRCALALGEVPQAEQALKLLAETRRNDDSDLRKVDEAYALEFQKSIWAEAERRFRADNPLGIGSTDWYEPDTPGFEARVKAAREKLRSEFFRAPLLGYTLPLWQGGPSLALPPIIRPCREALLVEADLALSKGEKRTAFLRLGDYLAYGALVPAEKRVELGRRRWLLARELGDEAAITASATELRVACQAVIDRLNRKDWIILDFQTHHGGTSHIQQQLLPELIARCQACLEELKK